MAPRQDLEQTQNFLRDHRLVNRLIRKAALTPADSVIDIGAGRGIFTEALAGSAGSVLAVELDPRHVQYLQERFRNAPNVIVFGADALAFPLPATPYKVFASIPYRWTAAIVAKLTTGTSPSSDSWLVVQKEAAERYIPFEPVTMVAMQLYPWFEVTIEHAFSRTDFRPRPSVDSVLMRIRQRPEPLLPEEERKAFEAVVATLFTAWKPTVGAALRDMMSRQGVRQLDRSVLDRLDARPGAVAPGDWVRLFREMTRINDAPFFREVSRQVKRLRAQQATIERPTQTRTRPRDKR